MKLLASKFLKLELWRKIVLIATFLVIAFVFYMILKSYTGAEYFTWLAQSFLHGHLFIDPSSLPPNKGDLVLFNGNYFWPNGPFPSILMLPFILLVNMFGFMPNQAFMTLLILPGIILLIYSLAKKIGYKSFDAWCFSVVFVAGSAFFDLLILPIAAYFAHVVVVFFIFATLYEYFHKKRYWLIGLFMACVFATRTTAGFGIAFFFLEIVTNKEVIKNKLWSITQLFTPLIFTALSLGLYNYIRFGKFLEQGYNLQIIDFAATEHAREYGLFGLIHLPGNLFYAFLQGPVPVMRDSISHVLQFPYINYDYWGMGIFFTSAYLLTLFFLSFSKPIQKNLLVTSLIVALPIFLYYGIGFVQVGYRYAFDFLPYLFLIFMIGYRETWGPLSKRMILLFLCSIAFNIFLVIYH